MLLANTVSVVTGGGSGIGRATAALFAREGSRVVVADLYGERAESVAKEIDDAGGTAMAVEADVATPEGVAHIFARAEEASVQFSCAYELQAADGSWARHTAILQEAEGEWVWIDGPTLCDGEEEPELN